MKEQLAAALAWTAGVGPAGQAAFVGLYVLATVAFLPGSVLTLGAGAAFGLWRGFALVSLASTLGACAAFLVGRFLLRDWVARRLEKVPAFAAVAGAVAAEGWKVVLLTRLSPVLPFNLLNYAYGLTEVRFGEYALASWVGMLPGTLLYVYLGTAAGEVARAGAGTRSRTPAEWALFAAGLAATALAAWLVGRKAKASLAGLRAKERVCFCRIPPDVLARLVREKFVERVPTIEMERRYAGEREFVNAVALIDVPETEVRELLKDDPAFLAHFLDCRRHAQELLRRV